MENVIFVGYIDASGNPSFVIGGIVGEYITAEEIDSVCMNNLYSFAEISLYTAQINSSYLGGVIGKLELLDSTVSAFGDVLGNSYSYLKNSLALHGTTTFIGSSSAIGNISSSNDNGGLSYYSMLESSDTAIQMIINLVMENVVKDWYIGAGIYYLGDGATPIKKDIGTIDNRIKITNHRQLDLLRIYPWLGFQQTNDIKLPTSTSIKTFRYIVADLVFTSGSEEYKIIINSYEEDDGEEVLLYIISQLMCVPHNIEVRQRRT